MTCAPRPASWRQTSNPMPRLPPVTTTIGGCPFAMANQPEWLKTIMRCHRGAVQCLHVSSTILKLPKLLRCRDFPLSARCGSRRRIFLMPKADVVVRASCACLSQLVQLCFRLSRPVGHAHFSVHRDRGGEVPMGLFVIARAAVKFAETEVAVSDLRTHAAGLS